MFPVEGDAHRGEQESGVLVVGGGSADGDVDVGDHPWRISVPHSIRRQHDRRNTFLGARRTEERKGREEEEEEEQKDSRIVIDLDLGETPHHVAPEPPAQIAAAIPALPHHPGPVLDPRHHHLDHFAQEMIHRLPPQLDRHTARPPLPEPEIIDVLLRDEDRRPDARDCLHDHARDVEVRAVGGGVLHEGVHVDFLEAGHVPEGDGAAEEGQDGPAARGAEGAVFVVGGGVVPGAEAGGGGAGEGAGRVVGVHQG